MNNSMKVLAFAAFCALLGSNILGNQDAQEAFDSLWNAKAITFNSVTGKIELNSNSINKMIDAGLISNQDIVIASTETDRSCY